MATVRNQYLDNGPKGPPSLRLIYQNDDEDEYSDDQPDQNGEEVSEWNIAGQICTEDPSRFKYSPKELSLNDPAQKEFTQNRDQKLLTKLHLKRMDIDQNRKYNDFYYRRDEYDDQYQLVRDFIQNTFDLNDSPSVSALKMRFDDPDWIYEFIFSSQPCFYFTISAIRNAYENLNIFSDQEANDNGASVARWSLLLKTTIPCATMVDYIDDKSVNVERIVFWIRIDMASIKNENYSKVDPKQLESLTITKDIYHIVQDVITEKTTPLPPAPIKISIPKVRVGGFRRTKRETTGPTTTTESTTTTTASMDCDTVLSTPPPPILPKEPMSPTKVNPIRIPLRVRSKLKGNADENSSASSGVKRKLVFCSSSDPMIISDSTTAQPQLPSDFMDVDSAPVDKPKVKKRKIIQDEDPPPPSTKPVENIVTLKDPERGEKKKLINEFHDLNQLFRAVLSAHTIVPSLGETELGGDSTSNTNDLIYRITSADEGSTGGSSQDKEEESMDMSLVNVANFMANVHDDAFNHVLVVKKEAIIHALICWLKVEVHNHLLQHVTVLFGDLYKEENQILQPRVFGAMQTSSVKLPIKQTKRNSRLAEIFPIAFIDFFGTMMQQGTTTKKTTPISPTIAPIIQCFHQIYEWRSKHTSLPSHGPIHFQKFKPGLVPHTRPTNSSTEHTVDVYWIWPDNSNNNTQTKMANFNHLDPAKFEIIHLRLAHSNKVNELYIVTCIEKYAQASKWCQFFVTILNQINTIVYETIPEFVEIEKFKYNDLMEKAKKDSGPNGSYSTSSISLRGAPSTTAQYQQPQLPFITTNTVMTNFFIWFITGTIPDTIPTNGELVPPFAVLTNQVRKELLRALAMLSYFYDTKIA